MSEIKKIFDKLVVEMWNIKDSKSRIETVDLITFGNKYFDAFNLLLDLINSNVIKDKEECNKPPSMQNDNIIINYFTKINGYNYNRLIVDTLIELNSKEAYSYLDMIVNTRKKKGFFISDFINHPDYEEITAKLSGN